MRLSMSKVTATFVWKCFHWCYQKFQQKGTKRAFMKQIVCNSKRSNPVLTKGNMFLLKLRERAARLFELKRIFSRRVNEGPCQETDQVCAVLIHQLQLSDQGWSLHYVVTTVRSAQAALEQAENKIRNQRLTIWKSRFCADAKFAGRWLKKCDTCAEVNIHTSKVSCASHHEAVNHICDFWANFWSLAEGTGPPVHEIGAQPVANAMRHETVWNDLEGVYFRQIAADMKGSAGGDGWMGLEVSRFPPALWDLSALIVKRWLLQGALPHMVLQARTVFLTKSKKSSIMVSPQRCSTYHGP